MKLLHSERHSEPGSRPSFLRLRSLARTISYYKFVLREEFVTLGSFNMLGLLDASLSLDLSIWNAVPAQKTRPSRMFVPRAKQTGSRSSNSGAVGADVGIPIYQHRPMGKMRRLPVPARRAHGVRLKQKARERTAATEAVGRRLGKVSSNK